MRSGDMRCADDKSEFKRNLLRRMEPLLIPHGVETATLAGAVESAFDEIVRDYDDLQSRFLSLTLWHVFDGGALWIDGRTLAGNMFPDDVLVAAYAMWRKARRFAKNHGADIMTASVALTVAAQATADALSGGRPVDDVRKYMFTAYRNRILRWRRFASRSAGLGEGGVSDGGAFSTEIEKKVLSRELLLAMPPKGRCVAMLWHRFNCDWTEIADILDTTVNAAQKALSVGYRKALETCLGDAGSGGVKKPGKRRKLE